MGPHSPTPSSYLHFPSHRAAPVHGLKKKKEREKKGEKRKGGKEGENRRARAALGPMRIFTSYPPPVNLSVLKEREKKKKKEKKGKRGEG